MIGIIFLEPVLKETIWGGSRLSEYGYKLPSDKVGEAWCISAHKNGDCKIANREYEGMTLSQLWLSKPELFGSKDNSKKPFPLLTKIIDAQDDLSIQVHPDDEYAKKNENGSLGKTECWYILDAKPETNIVIGHNAKDKNQVKSMIEQKQWSDFIRQVPVKKGDFFFIEPGTVHAIKGGTVILETQQSSDITYRVYDYDRLSNGKLRPLHVQQSIDIIKAPFVQKENPKDSDKTSNKALQQLVSCDLFTVWTFSVDGSAVLKQDQKYMLCSVIEGKGSVNGEPVGKGRHFIVPSGTEKIEFCGKMELVISAE